MICKFGRSMTINSKSLFVIIAIDLYCIQPNSADGAAGMT